MAYVKHTLATSGCGHKLLGVLLLIAATDCAHSRSGARSEAEANAGFARIQAYEARIAEAQRQIAPSATASTCPALCAATHAACVASSALCGDARALADPDALSRCARGTDACAGDRGQAASCSCAGDAK